MKLLFFLITLSFKFVVINCIPNLETSVIEGNYSTNHEITLDHTKEQIILFKDSQAKLPYTVFVWEKENNFDQPVFVVIRQQKYVTSWQIPYIIESKHGAIEFLSASKTLCHNNMNLISQLPRNMTDAATLPQFHKELSISLSTSSKTSGNIIVRVEELGLFYIKELKYYNIIAAVSHPRYYYYQFPDKNHENYSNTVLLEATSEDTTCMTISIQKPVCPVSDSVKDVSFTGLYQTVQTKGGIIIKEVDFPNGFFVVFLVKGDGSGCNQESSSIPKRTKLLPPKFNYTTVVKFQIKPTISTRYYYIAAFTVLAALLLFYVIFFLSTWGFYRCSNLWKRSGHESSESISLNRLDVFDSLDSKLTSSNLKLSDLARKDPRHFEKKSYTFLWHVISIAIFYGIPVVQLVIIYQRVVNISGNLDVCYYNFLCANPAFSLSDFNHVYSNVGYVLMGILFLIITSYRHKYLLFKPGYGIPKHYGLFYAMGVALIMEGILSASYHICPNQMNFQFDTSFMYVMAALCIVQLYQKRHPDINATAYAMFVALGIAIFAVMVGILNGHVSLWITFIVVYIVFCLYVSCNIYFISYVKKGLTSVYRDWHVDRNLSRALGPKRKTHFIILLIANTINIVMACMGIFCYYIGTDFATFLLGILMGNTVLYALVYIIMKLVYREKICAQAIIHGVLGLIIWSGAMYFFMSNTSLWSVSAAESKEFNQHCIFLDFYDHHDVWHLMSAVAMFFSFMLLLTLDDDLINTPHSDIMVF